MVSEKMLENWEKYKDLEYYPDRLCDCGCNGRIKVRKYHKKYGIPKYISGHNRAGRKKILRETRNCACGCGGIFECKVSSKQKYLPHHARRDGRIPRETRICGCGCKGTFECKVNSKQKYIHGHNTRNKSLSIEHRRKIGKSHLGKSCVGGSGKKLPRIKKICPGCGIEFTTPTGCQEREFHTQICYWKYIKKCWDDPVFANMMGRAQGRKPNKPEKFLTKLLQKLFPNQWKYVGDFKFWIDGANPDFININGQKKIIELFGNYWHSEEVTNTPVKLHMQKRRDHFAKYGFQTLIIWERELDNKSKLEKRLFQFNQQ